jgi:hypothetical protein
MYCGTPNGGLMAATSTTWQGATSIFFPSAVKTAAMGSLLLAGLTVTWTGLRLPGMGDPADLLVAFSFGLCALMVVFGDLRYAIPLWSLIPVVAIVACVLVRQFDPPPFYLQVIRLQIVGPGPNSLLKAVFWLFAIIIVPQTIIACTAIDRRVAVWTMTAYVTGTAISCGVAVVDLTGLTNLGRSLPGNLTTPLINSTVDSSNRMPGLTDHPNALGFTAVVSIPIVVYLMGTMRRRWIGVVMLIALLGGILASGSRGAQVVAPLALLAAVLWSPKKRSTARFFSISAFALVLAGVLILVSIPSNIRDSILRVTSFLSAGNASNTDRLELLGNGLLDWRLYPIFGEGIRHILEAHNIYVQLLAAGGLVLFGTMLIYWFAMLRDCWRLSAMGVVYARFLMISIGAWLALGLVENQLTERGAYFTVGCIAGLASAYLAGWPDAIEPEGAMVPEGDVLTAGGA